MSTIKATLEPDADGTLHLPLPPELRQGKVKVEAKVESASAGVGQAVPGLWKKYPDRFWMSADFDEPLEDCKEYILSPITVSFLGNPLPGE